MRWNYYQSQLRTYQNASCRVFDLLDFRNSFVFAFLVPSSFYQHCISKFLVHFYKDHFFKLRTLASSFEIEHFVSLGFDYSEFVSDLRLSGKIVGSDYLTSATLAGFQLDFYDVAGIVLAYTLETSNEIVRNFYCLICFFVDLGSFMRCVFFEID